jgi:hypothetical protein
MPSVSKIDAQASMKNFASKREQNQACLSYAEREQNRRASVNKE